jgi:uncharacterized integral membrane protein
MTGESETEGNLSADGIQEPLHTTGDIPPATPPAVASTGFVTPDTPRPEEPTGADERTGAKPVKSAKPATTIAARVWVALGIAVVLLVLLIIFIAENSSDVTIKFLGAKGTLSVALMMLISALAGVVITLLVGTARILQLRREVRRRS